MHFRVHFMLRGGRTTHLHVILHAHAIWMWLKVYPVSTVDAITTISGSLPVGLVPVLTGATHILAACTSNDQIWVWLKV